MQPISGLQPHTRAERWATIEKLVPLWQEKFGENLLAIAVSASVARGADSAYSDLELDVFVREKPAEGDHYLQRVVAGMLIEAIYHTPEEFLHERMLIADHWHMSASDRLVGVYNAPFVEDLMSQIKKTQHTESEFIRAATRERFELQESFSKVLNAVEQQNVEGVSLLVMDAVLHLLHMLAFLNQHSFTTFSRYISEARSFAIQPERFDDLLDVLVKGSYQDLTRLREIILAVFASLENIFAQRGILLYDDALDPNLPNRRYLDPESL